MRDTLASAMCASSRKKPWCASMSRWALKPLGYGASSLREHVAVAGEGIAHGIGGQSERHPEIAGRGVERSVGHDDRRALVKGRGGRHREERGEVTAARAARDGHARGIDAEAARVGAHPPEPRRHVGARRGVLVIGAHAEVEGDDHDPARGEPAAEHRARRPVEARPRAAVHVDDGGQGAGGGAHGTIDASRTPCPAAARRRRRSLPRRTAPRCRR